MRLKTIWTLRHMALAERLRRTNEVLALWLAHRLPRRVAYWSLIDSGVRYMTKDVVVPEETFMNVLENFGREMSTKGTTP